MKKNYPFLAIFVTFWLFSSKFDPMTIFRPIFRKIYHLNPFISLFHPEQTRNMALNGFLDRLYLIFEFSEPWKGGPKFQNILKKNFGGQNFFSGSKIFFCLFLPKNRKKLINSKKQIFQGKNNILRLRKFVRVKLIGPSTTMERP